MVFSVKVVHLTLHHTFNLQIQERILGRTYITNHNMMLLTLQVGQPHKLLRLRTTLGKHGMIPEPKMTVVDGLKMVLTWISELM